MNKEILTIEKLKAMKPDTIFASGIGLIEHPWFNNARYRLEGGTLEPDGKSTKVRWVAIRGYIHDWAIYHSMDANFIQADYLDDPIHLEISEERIAKAGAKLYGEQDIKRLVPCNDEAFKIYRY